VDHAKDYLFVDPSIQPRVPQQPLARNKRWSVLYKGTHCRQSFLLPLATHLFRLCSEPLSSCRQHGAATGHGHRTPPRAAAGPGAQECVRDPPLVAAARPVPLLPPPRPRRPPVVKSSVYYRLLLIYIYIYIYDWSLFI
jgi:hypothetical protein